MTDIPHFRLPFNFVSAGRRTIAAEVEQGSADEIFDCVQAVVRTIMGTRIENPDFGIRSQDFHMGDLNRAQLQAQILEWEPRAQVILSSRWDEIDAFVQHLDIEVHSGKTGESGA